jgi:hypothetical protein
MLPVAGEAGSLAGMTTRKAKATVTATVKVKAEAEAREQAVG